MMRKRVEKDVEIAKRNIESGIEAFFFLRDAQENIHSKLNFVLCNIPKANKFVKQVTCSAGFEHVHSAG